MTYRELALKQYKLINKYSELNDSVLVENKKLLSRIKKLEAHIIKEVKKAQAEDKKITIYA